jgi:hypothetical protein
MRLVSGQELYDFYAHLGQVLYLIQHVEDSLHKALSIKIDFAAGPVNQNQADEIIEKYRKRALGQLIGIARRNGVFSTQSHAELEGLNDKRRLIVHRLQQQAEHRLRTDPNWRQQAVSYLDSVADEAAALNGKLTGELLEMVGRDVTGSSRFDTALAAQLQQAGFS